MVAALVTAAGALLTGLLGFFLQGTGLRRIQAELEILEKLPEGIEGRDVFQQAVSRSLVTYSASAKTRVGKAAFVVASITLLATGLLLAVAGFGVLNGHGPMWLVVLFALASSLVISCAIVMLIKLLIRR